MTVQNLNLNIERRSLFKRFDWNYAAIIMTLQIIGLINLYSAAYSTDYLNRVFYAQLLWIPLGWVAFFIMSRFDYRNLLKYTVFFYWVNVIALVMVLFVGRRFYGARRWLDLGIFNFQPSETMKLFLVLFMGHYLAKNKLQNFGFVDLVKPCLILGIPFLLTAKQPDLGTALLLLAIPSSMILFLKVQKKVIITFIATLAFSIPIVWSSGLLKEYQKDRVRDFLNPERDPRGKSYNSIQAKIAIGSGQVLGRGFQQGSQNQLQFLPERHSDFIFCVLSEEYGFIGGMFTLACFLILLFFILNIARESEDRSGALICVGFAAFIFWHMVINIGMVAGLLPVVGVPLPLLSYGGSSMITFMTCLGIVASVGNKRFMF